MMTVMGISILPRGSDDELGALQSSPLAYQFLFLRRRMDSLTTIR